MRGAAQNVITKTQSEIDDIFKNIIADYENAVKDQIDDGTSAAKIGAEVGILTKAQENAKKDLAQVFSDEFQFHKDQALVKAQNNIDSAFSEIRYYLDETFCAKDKQDLEAKTDLLLVI